MRDIFQQRDIYIYIYVYLNLAAAGAALTVLVMRPFIFLQDQSE